MGLGGNLMWTAVFREFWEKNNGGNKNLKLLPIGSNNLIVKDSLWSGNPYITFNPKYKPLVKFQLKDSTHISNFKGYDIYRENEHIIKSRCKNYNIENPILKCELYFNRTEEDKVRNILKTLPKNFICIEPNSKETFTKNKFYPFDKFQKIRNHFKDLHFVQVGNKQKILDNVINVVGKLTFRETALLIKYCDAFIGIEGGLIHCCNAVGCKKAFVIVPPMFKPNLVAYPDYKYIWLGNETHGSCGMRILCKYCHSIIKNHNEQIVIDEISKYL